MAEIPAPAHVLQALAPVWPPLYTALEWAMQQTRAYFDAEGTPVDRHLAPSLVRYQVKRSLARLGHAVQEEDDEAYAFQTLPNNGLSLSYRGDLLDVLRILKALEGQLPATGASRARQAFWHQQLLFEYAAPSAAQLRPSLARKWPACRAPEARPAARDDLDIRRLAPATRDRETLA